MTAMLELQTVGMLNPNNSILLFLIDRRLPQNCVKSISHFLSYTLRIPAFNIVVDADYRFFRLHIAFNSLSLFSLMLK